MKHSLPPPGNNGPSGMTLQRLQHLLDAYGANPDRWPWQERFAALLLLERSAEARAQRDEAARLDTLLDLAPTTHPSVELATRILVAAPAEEIQPESPTASSRRSGRRHQPDAPRRSRKREKTQRLRVWLPLAAAASLAIVLWNVWSLPPSRHELSSAAIANLSVYATPTDVLLQWPGVDFLNTTPFVGCQDSELGCPQLHVSPGVQPRSQARERRYV